MLAYHGFGTRTVEDDPHNMFVSVDSFTRQLDYLLARGWTPLDLSAYLGYLECWPTPRRSFLITIDDGFVSTLDVAEVITSRGVRPILFVSAGLLGRTSRTWAPEMRPEPLLDPAGVRAAMATGFEVGVHGWDHASMRAMSEADLNRNTLEAKEVLHELLGVRPRAFAYPKGHFDDTGRRAVEAAGYAVAFSVERSTGRFAVPRVDVNATDTTRTFAWKCSPWWSAARVAGRKIPAVRRAVHVLAGSAR